MKRSILLGLIISLSAWAGPFDCRKANREMQKDLKALGKYLEGGSDSMKTKSNNPMEMVKEYVKTQNDGDLSGYSFKERAKGIPTGESEAGTTYSSVALGAIMDTVDTWYLGEDSDSAEAKAKRKKIKAAAEKTLSNRLIPAYDAGAQGWGGSPATNLLYLSPKCKTVFSLFLGIVHD